jgi:hypothetical protein
MLCPITNGSAVYLPLGGEVSLNTLSYTKFRINPEDLIRLEMSFVAEVESVFVESAPRRAGFHVFTIVNERNPDVRSQIYRREQAIMDEFKNLEFDFRIIARRNRDIKDIITGLGEPVFSR